MSKKNIFLVMGFIFIIAFGYLFLQINSFKEITRTTKKGEISEKIETKGIIIFEEKLYTSPETVTVNHVYSNNDKIRKGTLICKLNDSEISEVGTDKQENQDYESIITEIKTKEFKIYEIKTMKDRYIKSHYTKDSNDSNNVKDNVNVNSARKNIYAEEAGYISYYSDRLENKYSLENIGNIEFGTNYPKFQDLREQKVVNKDEIIVKVINNYKWYIAVKLTDEQIKLIEKEYFVNIIVNKDEKMRGKLIKIVNNNENSYVVLQFAEYGENYLNIRNADIDVVLKSHEGLIVPNTSIIDYRNNKGVFVENIDGTFSFKPVEIIIQNQYNSIIKENIFIEEDDNGEKKKIYTVRMYDDVLIDGNRVSKHKIR